MEAAPYKAADTKSSNGQRCDDRGPAAFSGRSNRRNRLAQGSLAGSSRRSRLPQGRWACVQVFALQVLRRGIQDGLLHLRPG